MSVVDSVVTSVVVVSVVVSVVVVVVTLVTLIPPLRNTMFFVILDPFVSDTNANPLSNSTG